jgi:signal transduction histidine kinase
MYSNLTSFDDQLRSDHIRSGDFRSFKINKAISDDAIPGPSATVSDPFSQFMFALAHEVRNPLTNINISLELLDSAIRDIELKPYLNIIARGAKRINDLILELIGHQERNESLIKTEKFSLYQLIDEVLEMAADRLLIKNIEVSKEYAAADCKLFSNKQKMNMALTNIVVNAIDAMTPGKGVLKLATRSIEGNFVLCIEDNGCGIKKEDLKLIFEPYFTSKEGGLGLGLTATLNILKSNRVGIVVKSVLGIGTSFVLSFNRKNPTRWPD